MPEWQNESYESIKKYFSFLGMKCQHCDSRLRLAIAPSLGLLALGFFLILLLGPILQLMGFPVIFFVVYLFILLPLFGMVPFEAIRN